MSASSPLLELMVDARRSRRQARKVGPSLECSFLPSDGVQHDKTISREMIYCIAASRSHVGQKQRLLRAVSVLPTGQLDPDERIRDDERAVNGMVKRTAAKAGINGAVSPHWLRHAHGSHAIDRGASLPEVQKTLGHGNIATTSGYLHARPDTSSGLHLDPGVFLR